MGYVPEILNYALDKQYSKKEQRWEEIHSIS